MTNTIRTSIADTLTAAARDLMQQAKTLEQQAAELIAQGRMARGTREIAPVVVEAAQALEVKPSAPELLEQVRTLITARPYSFRDLCTHLDIGPTDENRIKSVLVRLQRDAAGVVNLGSGSKALWFIPDDAVIAKLTKARKAARK